MKIVRLLLVLLALSVTTLSAAPRKSGSFGEPGKAGAQNKQASEWYYYCYRDGISKPCDGYDDCLSACLADCGPPCNYEGQQLPE